MAQNHFHSYFPSHSSHSLISLQFHLFRYTSTKWKYPSTIQTAHQQWFGSSRDSRHERRSESHAGRPKCSKLNQPQDRAHQNSQWFDPGQSHHESSHPDPWWIRLLRRQSSRSICLESNARRSKSDHTNLIGQPPSVKTCGVFQCWTINHDPELGGPNCDSFCGPWGRYIA